ncbi:NAD-dependent epimerase/dehydratase family protein [Sphingomonas sp. CJ20]
MMGGGIPITLVAGGAGFLGSHLCEAILSQGRALVCLDNLQTSSKANIAHLLRNPNFRFIHADVIDPLPDEVLSLGSQVTQVYNLACAASPPQYLADPEHTMLTNVVGTNHLLRFSERNNARFVLASTSEIYGDPDVHPQREEYRGAVNCTGPRACYDEGKRAAEAMTFDFGRLGRADVRVARIFNAYGPQMHPADGRVISNFVTQILQRRDVTIYGDGTQTRSFCYVSDIIRGLVALMDSDGLPVGPINLGNPYECSINELLDMIVALSSPPARIVYQPLPMDDPHQRRPDITRAHRLIAWSPTVPLRRGLIETIAWFTQRLGIMTH